MQDNEAVMSASTSDIKLRYQKRRRLYQILSGDLGRDLRFQIEEVGGHLANSIEGGGKVLIFGNGGSAAQAQHFTAELICKFEKERVSLPAIALTTDTSVITAQGNDYGFEHIFSRQIEGLGLEGDVAIGLTTSDFRSSPEGDHSLNIRNAFMTANKKRIKTVGFFSLKTKELLTFVDHPIVVPHNETFLVQEVHLSIIHDLCAFIDSRF